MEYSILPSFPSQPLGGCKERRIKTDTCIIFDQNRSVYYDTLVGIYRTDFSYYSVLESYISKSLMICEEHLRK